MAGTEILSEENRVSERVYLGLRTSNGLVLCDEEQTHVQPWIDAGWGLTDGARLRLTPRGWLRLDALASSLTMIRSR